MNKKEMALFEKVQYFLNQGKESEMWDYKQEWHENMADLIKDIVCFANTVHDKDCYLIFGVSDDLEICGMKKARRKQADIIDTISKLYFAGGIYPHIDVSTVIYEEIELDILTVYNTDRTPIYLEKPYGKMQPGCIYTRTGDKNTPDNSNANIIDIENLWKKRLGLTKSHLNYIYDKLSNRLEWSEGENCYYNIYKPEYTLEIQLDYDKIIEEFYSYIMMNETTMGGYLYIKYQQTILKKYQIVNLDSAQLMIPTPDTGFIHYGKFNRYKYSYKYFIMDSPKYKLLYFMYDSSCSEQTIAFQTLEEVVLFYNSNEEKNNFEKYLHNNMELFNQILEKTNDYDYIETDSLKKTEAYRERIHVGISLNKMLFSWRKEKFEGTSNSLI